MAKSANADDRDRSHNYGRDHAKAHAATGASQLNATKLGVVVQECYQHLFNPRLDRDVRKGNTHGKGKKQRGKPEITVSRTTG